MAAKTKRRSTTRANQTPKKRRKIRAKPHVWKKRFLKALRDSGIVREACESSRISRGQAYAARHDDEVFAAAWEAAMQEAVDLLESVARDRAVGGWDEPVFYQGVACGAIRRRSDTLLMFLMKAHAPERFRDNYSIEHSGPHGAPLAPATVIVYMPDNGRDPDPAPTGATDPVPGE